MNPNLPTYKDPPPPPMKKPEPPPTQIIQDGVLPPNNKIAIGEIREDVPTENKYFNAESIKHIIIFSLICLTLKGLEVYCISIWNKFKIFYNDNISYFALIYILLAIIIINRFDNLFFKPSRKKNDRITKWLNKNL